MSQSPLQLKHYHFLKLCLKAREELGPEESANRVELYPDFGDVHLLPKVTLYTDDSNGTPTYLLRLTLEHKPEKSSLFPYCFEVALEGLFTVNPDRDAEEVKRLVVYNGASLLYTAAREQLITLSLRHIYGPIMLPTLNFQWLDV